MAYIPSFRVLNKVVLMASVKKFNEAAVVNLLRHCNREIYLDSNQDIDPTRTGLNYNLTPYRDQSDYEYYKQRKSELYCYNRADVKTMAGWIVTAPIEIETYSEQMIFFETVTNFLSERYGIENIVNVSVHYDEGKMEKLLDKWGNPITDDNGLPIKRLVLGRPHLHFNFIPVTADKNPKHKQSQKICANNVLNKKDLQHFHPDLQKYLNEHGIKANVNTGVTKKNGRNYTVQEMKEKYELDKELKRLHDIEEKYNLSNELTYNSDNGKGTWW